MAEDVQINWGKVKNIFESVTERMGQNPDRPAIGAPRASLVRGFGASAASTLRLAVEHDSDLH